MENKAGYCAEGIPLTELFGWKHVREGQFRALIYAYSGQNPLVVISGPHVDGEADYSNGLNQFFISSFSKSELERITSFVQNLNLTPAQLAMFVLCARSVSAKGICATLDITNQTYKNHMQNIFDKVEGYYNKRIDRLGVTVLALKNGVLPIRCILDEKRVKEIKYLVDRLTMREKEVLKLALCGKQNKEIARDLGISSGTVTNHMTNIYKELQIYTGTQYSRSAGRWNLVPTAISLGIV